MDNIKDFPAFPRQHDKEGHNGMTLRDYFAAKAMQALINGYVRTDMKVEPKVDSERSYEIADAMLKAREA